MYHFGKQIFENHKQISVRKKFDIGFVEHTHDFIELIYIESGVATQKINDIEFPVKKGDLVFINYGKAHSFRSDKGFTFYDILLTPTFLSDELINSENAMDLLSLGCFESFSDFTDEPKISFGSDEIVFIEHMISEMAKEYEWKKSGFEQALKGYITVLLIHIFRKMEKKNIFLREKKIPTEILDYLDNNYNEKITVSNLAERCFYSPVYFSRIFSETYGITVTEYVLQKRFEKACMLLSTTKQTIEEVAQNSGYRDGAAIFRHFKKKLGITPGEYRKSKKQQ